MNKFKSLLAWLYFFAAVLYVTWGTFEGRGLPGFFTHLSLSYFNWSSDELTAGFSIILLLAPLVLFRNQLKSMNKEPQGMGKTVLYVSLTLAPLILGFAGRSYLIRNDAEQSSLVLQEFVLAQSSLVEINGESALVRLQGAYLLPAALQYSKEDYGEDHFAYVPLVAPDFSGEPVEFVLVAKQRENPVAYLPNATGLPFIRLAQEQELATVTFEGLAHKGRVPLYAEQEWKQNGLDLANEYYLLEARVLVNDKLPSRLQYLRPEWAFYLGVALSCAIGLGLALGTVLKK